MMDIREYLKEFAQQDCACGKSHAVELPRLVVESGAIVKIPQFVGEFGAKKPFLLADAVTYEVAGGRVCEILAEAGIECEKYVFPVGVEPDEVAIDSATTHFDDTCDIVIGVGSGVINDIGKMLANAVSKPYFIVATAPSMDGYASATSSMSIGGLKVSLDSKRADLIIGDIDILKHAPSTMLVAGLGDMLAKYVSIAEWRIAHEVTGEYYCERVADLIRGALCRCVDNVDGLLNREDDAVRSVFEGLVIGGVAMAFAGVSRPASGVEHYFSHVWDMRGLAYGTQVQLHGIQCAVATYIASGLYEKVLGLIPDRDKAIRYAETFDYPAWADMVRSLLGAGGDAMVSLEEKEQKYSPLKHRERIEVICAKWDKILKIIREEIPSQREIGAILDKIGAPKSIEEIGVDLDMPTTLCLTKDIRDKYVLSRLLWDIGVIDEIV